MDSSDLVGELVCKALVSDRHPSSLARATPQLFFIRPLKRRLVFTKNLNLGIELNLSIFLGGILDITNQR